MTDIELRAKVLEIVKQFAKEQREPAADESLFSSGLLDSFSLPDMVGALEEAFHIRIPDSDLNPRQFETVVRIEAYLSGKI